MRTAKGTSRRAHDSRSKRSARSQKRNKLGWCDRGRKEDRPAVPPVFSREDLAGGSMPERRRSTKTRRRYDLSLSTPGAEMRLPAIPEVRLGWRLFSGFAVAGLLFLLFWMWNSTMFRVGLVEVEGLRRLTLQAINAPGGA